MEIIPADPQLGCSRLTEDRGDADKSNLICITGNQEEVRGAGGASLAAP